MANLTDKTSVDTVVEAFHRQNPGIRVTVTFADTNTLQKELPGKLREGEGPDVFTVWPGSGNPASATALERDNVLEELTLRRFNRTMPEGVRPVVGVLGSTHIVPMSFSAIGAIYSERTLHEIGGSAPTTWTELLELCATARKHGKVLFALGNATPWVTQLVDYALVATTVYAEHPDFDQQMTLNRQTFAASGWRTALEKYLEMNDRGCFSPKPLDTTYEDSLDQVTDGRAVGVIQVASALSALRTAEPGLKLRMSALPATDDPKDTRMPGAVSAAYGLNANSAHREAALQFIDFLGSREGQNLYNSSGATLPALPNPSFAVDPAIEEVARRQMAGATVPFMDQRWPNSNVQQTHFAQIRALFAGTTDVGDALTALDHAYRKGR
ncbi:MULTISPECIES: ABC transporter substrate-binding protein [unclassified Streptomyces]|uniref:ABC transporter substrate-binding protein n=1 Tax=unclassified Streptomyces TaxID=2593676 RepID=UPI000AF329D4|nr:ABC transporter substrate-binding protein [Streptomyces sp. TSRI0107]